MLRQSIRRVLPENGAVGGIDVGWSQKRASSAVARLHWTPTTVGLAVCRCRAVEPERSATIQRVLGGRMSTVAIDGPLCSGLEFGSNYRRAERILTLGFQPLIGKPGQTNSPNGRLLNVHATACAKILIEAGLADDAAHEEMIHTLSIVEAFPTSFLGVLLPNPEGLKTRRKASSDVFYEALALSDELDALLKVLLPDRTADFSFSSLRNHDDRAAVVCALTALCVSAGDYTAVGDADGWIILPPFQMIAQWAHDIFNQNASRLSAVSVSSELLGLPGDRRQTGGSHHLEDSVGHLTTTGVRPLRFQS